jgi:hypothetical protein
MRRGKKKGQPKKTKHWTLPTVLGLALSAVGAVAIIELKPQINVAPQEQLNRTQVFTAPFRIDNTGYVRFHVEKVFVYARILKAGPLSITHAVSSEDEWNNQDIERGEGETITPHIFRSPVPPDQADIAIVVDYRWWGSLSIWKPSRQYFRFKRFDGPYEGTWEWLKQPASDMKGEIDAEIEQARKRSLPPP